MHFGVMLDSSAAGAFLRAQTTWYFPSLSIDLAKTESNCGVGPTQRMTTMAPMNSAPTHMQPRGYMRVGGPCHFPKAHVSFIGDTDAVNIEILYIKSKIVIYDMLFILKYPCIIGHIITSSKPNL